jgi:hypothetical protein
MLTYMLTRGSQEVEEEVEAEGMEDAAEDAVEEAEAEMEAEEEAEEAVTSETEEVELSAEAGEFNDERRRQQRRRRLMAGAGGGKESLHALDPNMPCPEDRFMQLGPRTYSGGFNNMMMTLENAMVRTATLC